MAEREFLLSQDNEPFVDLGKGKEGSRLVKKQLLRYGTWVHPQDKRKKLKVTEDLIDKLVTNFESGKSTDIVTFPMADETNAHNDLPERNIGQVVSLKKEDKGLYAVIDVRKHQDDVGKTILGASARFRENDTDKETGEPIGPVLLHVLATNRPYITDLDGYEEVVAASDDNCDDLILLSSEEEQQMPDKPTKDDLIKLLREEHKIDVESLLEQDKKGAEPSEEDVKKLQGVIDAAVKAAQDEARDKIAAAAGIKLSDTDDDETDLADIVTKAVKEATSDLSDTVEELKADKAKARVAQLMKEGKILPKQKDAMEAIALSDPDTFEAIVPDEPVVKVGDERGTDEFGDTNLSDETKIVEEAERIVSAHADFFAQSDKEK